MLTLLLLTLTACYCNAWSTGLSQLTHRHAGFTRTPRYVDSGRAVEPPISRISLKQEPQGKPSPKRWLRPLTRLAGLLLVTTALISPQAAMASDAVIATDAVVATAMPPLSLPPAIPAMVQLRLCLRLLFASLLGAAVGQERSSTHKHSAGVRTMALVALGACAFTICSSFGFAGLASKADPSRMASNVASGVGFVGAGVITTTSANPKDSRQSIVHGLTTATAIWISAAIGVCSGVGMHIIATAATLSTISILRFGTVKKKIRAAKYKYQGDFHFVDPRPPSMPPPVGHKDLRSVITSLELKKRREEEEEDDEWDSFPQTHEVEEEDEEEVIVSQQQTSSSTMGLQEVLLDHDVAEFHLSGQAALLEKAHSASRGNMTELVATTSSHKPAYSGSKNETVLAP